jgi:acyl-CoA thioesterase FadM
VGALTFTPRQCETNPFGRIATVSYVIYFEEARISYLKKRGADVQGNDYILLVSSINCKFIKECGIEDHLLVETVIVQIRENGFTVMQQMKSEVTGELIANAETEMVYIRNGDHSASAMPESLVHMLEITNYNFGNES